MVQCSCGFEYFDNFGQPAVRNYVDLYTYIELPSFRNETRLLDSACFVPFSCHLGTFDKYDGMPFLDNSL